MGRGRSAVGTAGVVWPLAPLDGFTRYLRVDRGLSTLTVEAYVSDVGRFLARWEGSDLRELTAAEVSTALLGELDHRSPATVRRYGRVTAIVPAVLPAVRPDRRRLVGIGAAGIG